MLEIRNLTKTFDGQNAVEDVSLTIYKGEIFALLGPSGCGKSTLLRMLAGFEQPTEGQIVLDGQDMSHVPPYQRPINMMFQSYALFPHMTVEQNIAFGLKQDKMPRAEIAERVAEMLALVHMQEYAKRKPHQLSGGQQQRVAIGRALVYNPPVILLDEPLSNLDAKLREEARVFLRELIIKLGLSALMVTHDQNEAMAISDRILLLNNGKIEQQGTPQEMYGSPTTLFTAEFMGSNNRLPGKIVALEGDRARIEGKDWALWGKAGAGVQVGQEGTAVIRVERVQLGEDPQGNQLELPLLTSMYLGDRWEYLFRTVAEDFVVRAYGHEARDRALCRLSLPAEHLWIFPKA
ncbi:ABC transporter ATP-binding protein [Serratia marcescens]|nr:ABC transporter ATP-binding protein [Serratia marcescens]RTG60966.1 ABC transporter ATP-binding protein [Serratia marcescens]